MLEGLKRPEAHEGDWRLWSCRPAWEGNGTWDQFIVFSWQQGQRRLLGAVNYGPSQGQCYVSLNLPGLAGHKFVLADLLGEARYEREGDGLVGNGLYLDMPPWGCHLFAFNEQPIARPAPAPRAKAPLAV